MGVNSYPAPLLRVTQILNSIIQVPEVPAPQAQVCANAAKISVPAAPRRMRPARPHRFAVTRPSSDSRAAVAAASAVVLGTAAAAAASPVRACCTDTPKPALRF